VQTAEGKSTLDTIWHVYKLKPTNKPIRF